MAAQTQRRGGPMPHTPEFTRFKVLMAERGLTGIEVAGAMGMAYANLWKMLHRAYGYPDTAENRSRLCAAIASLSGEPCEEAAIWEPEPVAAE